MNHWKRLFTSVLVGVCILSGCSPFDSRPVSSSGPLPQNSITNSGTSTPSPSPSDNHTSNGPGGSSNHQPVPPTNPSPSPQPKPPSTPTYPVLHEGSSGQSVVLLQQLLAAHGYLPLTWTPNSPQATSSASPQQLLASPPSGAFAWKYKATPSSLKALWKPGSYTVLVKGAVMTYQEAHHLSIDGIAGAQLWTTLLNDSSNSSPYGYSYVQVQLHQPQKLTIWYNGKTVLTTLVNTGIAQSPTVTGAHPVYLRYQSQTMSGTDPWGNHYSDPGIPWVSYFYGGEAIHGFVRAQYGYPQSLGCVELPISQSKIAWKYMQYGTLVNVS